MTLAHFDGDYAHRLGPVTGHQLQAALDRFDLGRLLAVEPVRGGIFGQNMFLTTDKGEWVLRGKSHYDWQFSKERFFARLIYGQTDVPAPWPYLIDDSTDIFGFDYALMPRLPGLQLADKAVRQGLTTEDETGIAAAMGRALASLQAITSPHCADTNNTSGEMEPITASYRDWITGTVERRIASSQDATPYMTAADAAWCHAVFEANADALDVPFQPILVHHDFKLGNVVVQPDDNSWRVSGVFDLMECFFGHPEEDLVRLCIHYQHERPGLGLPAAFIRAYAAARPLGAGFRERFRINTLRDCLLIWEFGIRFGPVKEVITSEHWYDPALGFRTFAEPHVSLDPFP